MFLIAGYHPDARIHAASPTGGFFIKHGLKVVVIHTLGETYPHLYN
ncbi:hypothetical protein [Peribacillus butanolivorans]